MCVLVCPATLGIIVSLTRQELQVHGRLLRHVRPKARVLGPSVRTGTAFAACPSDPLLMASVQARVLGPCVRTSFFFSGIFGRLFSGILGRLFSGIFGRLEELWAFDATALRWGGREGGGERFDARLAHRRRSGYFSCWFALFVLFVFARLRSFRSRSFSLVLTRFRLSRPFRSFRSVRTPSCCQPCPHSPS